MLTRLRVRNFKRFESLDIQLGERVVFIGPNNSGKTTAMQALALWETGVHEWLSRRGGQSAPERRPGVAINRRNLTALPVPEARALWHRLKLRKSSTADGKQQNENIRIEIIVNGETDEQQWACGLEFDYANEESLYCRPLRRDASSKSTRTRWDVPEIASQTSIAMLPPMSGLTSNEDLLQLGSLNVRIGQGRTAEVLRNICYLVSQDLPDAWGEIVGRIHQRFGVRLNQPRYIIHRGQMEMSYYEDGIELDLTAAGRGLHQVLLLLTYMYMHPNSVLLLDEPDAHLEVLRQREVYEMISEVAASCGSQVVAGSHSEVMLNEAADRDIAIAFIGEPHRIDDQGAQVAKSLSRIGWDQYAQATQTGWVLYLEGSTDLAILRALAQRLQHQRAMTALERPFVYYIGNVISNAQTHFYGLREAVPNLKAITILDLDPGSPPSFAHAEMQMWRRREIESYICSQAALEAYAWGTKTDDDFEPETLFGISAAKKRVEMMRESINEIGISLDRLNSDPRLAADIKASETILDTIFRSFYGKLDLYNPMAKRDFHKLIQYVPIDEIDSEVHEKLDAIADVAESATPAGL